MYVKYLDRSGDVLLGKLRKRDYLELEYRIHDVMRKWSREINYSYEVMNKDVVQILASMKDDVDWYSNSSKNMYVLDMAYYIAAFALRNKLKLNKRRLNNALFIVDLCSIEYRNVNESLYVDDTGVGYYSVLYDRIHDVFGLFGVLDISHMPFASLTFVEDHFLRELGSYGLDQKILDDWIVRSLEIDEDAFIEYLIDVPLYKGIMDKKNGHEFIKFDTVEFFEAIKFERNKFLNMFGNGMV